MYGIYCVPFLFGKPLVKNTLSNPFPKNAQIMNLKNPDLDLIGFTFSLEEDIRLLIPSQFAFILLRFSSKKEL